MCGPNDTGKFSTKIGAVESSGGEQRILNTEHMCESNIEVLFKAWMCEETHVPESGRATKV